MKTVGRNKTIKTLKAQRKSNEKGSILDFNSVENKESQVFLKGADIV